MRKALFFLFFSFLFLSSSAQVLPHEGSILHYRLIGFSVMNSGKASNSLLQIARGHFQSEDSFSKNIIKTVSLDTNKVIAEVPFWGNQYTWRVISSDNSKATKTGLYHFCTAMVPEVDSNRVRLRIIQATGKYDDAFVFLDNSRALYNMRGKPVWFLPDTVFKDLVSMHSVPELRDLKLSCKGTITFLLNSQAYEVNYEGDILWKGPNSGSVAGDVTERYHHEFTRLCSGHYMILGQEKSVLWPPKGNKGCHSSFGTIIEYDEKGKVVWSWKSSDYFSRSDLVYSHSTHDTANKALDVHENALYFDEEHKIIYISYRDISRIIKIKYPEGKVLASYGTVYKPGDSTQKENGLFCKQHSIKRSDNGYLYLFNNNTCKPGAPPEVLLMKEVYSNKNSLEKIWDYQCSFDQDFYKTDKTVGGNVSELPDSSLFVSMGGEYSRIFIVNRNKELLWSALPELWDMSENKWVLRDQYRCSIIVNPADLYRLVWARQ